MLVIADATPLIALSDVGRLSLLQTLYHEVLIPPSVEREAFQLRGRQRDPWLRVESPIQPVPSSVSSADLGPGETEALALALERHADLLLIDDRKGRGVAKALGLPIAGTVAILLRSKEAGLIPSVRPLLDQLISNGLRVSSGLYAAALRMAREE